MTDIQKTREQLDDPFEATLITFMVKIMQAAQKDKAATNEDFNEVMAAHTSLSDKAVREALTALLEAMPEKKLLMHKISDDYAVGYNLALEAVTAIIEELKKGQTK